MNGIFIPFERCNGYSEMRLNIFNFLYTELFISYHSEDCPSREQRNGIEKNVTKRLGDVYCKSFVLQIFYKCMRIIQ